MFACAACCGRSIEAVSLSSMRLSSHTSLRIQSSRHGAGREQTEAVLQKIFLGSA
jgi:hypothetical protein